ncbi:MAG: YbhB/YbcL family Raf kinase inhibitor-like protein [Acidimicrobiia bacterium]|nr:YbhB/YbcL family Raf kinase inhibitor-like protein [Acidimicrobiia bacterium]
MNLTITGVTDGQPIPSEFAFCIPDPDTHATFAPNRNPALSWENVPDGTASFAILCWDRTVPTVGDDVNQEGREVPPDLPRTDFFHWVQVDIAADTRGVAAGTFSDGVTARGKSGPEGPNATRQGLNDYTGWFTGDPDMEGLYFGYDGPCPPWNDSLIHEYTFALYALDVDRCPVEGDFTGSDVRDAIAGHVLAEASVIGTYTLNPRLL